MRELWLRRGRSWLLLLYCAFQVRAPGAPPGGDSIFLPVAIPPRLTLPSFVCRCIESAPGHRPIQVRECASCANHHLPSHVARGSPTVWLLVPEASRQRPFRGSLCPRWLPCPLSPGALLILASDLGIPSHGCHPEASGPWSLLPHDEGKVHAVCLLS